MRRYAAFYLWLKLILSVVNLSVRCVFIRDIISQVLQGLAICLLIKKSKYLRLTVHLSTSKHLICLQINITKMAFPPLIYSIKMRLSSPVSSFKQNPHRFCYKKKTPCTDWRYTSYLDTQDMKCFIHVTSIVKKNEIEAGLFQGYWLAVFELRCLQGLMHRRLKALCALGTILFIESCLRFWGDF